MENIQNKFRRKNNGGRKMKKIKTYIILAMIMVGGVLSVDGHAEIRKEFSDLKLSTNFVNLIAFGDLNVSLERKVKEKESLLVGIHSNSDSLTSKTTGTSGGYIGYRVYPTIVSSSSDLSGGFVQLTFGLNKFNKYKGLTKSVEFWIGKSTYIGTNLGVEVGLGVGRQYEDDSKPMGLAGLNLVYSL